MVDVEKFSEQAKKIVKDAIETIKEKPELIKLSKKSPETSLTDLLTSLILLRLGTNWGDQQIQAAPELTEFAVPNVINALSAIHSIAPGLSLAQVIETYQSNQQELFEFIPALDEAQTKKCVSNMYLEQKKDTLPVIRFTFSSPFGTEVKHVVCTTAFLYHKRSGQYGSDMTSSEHVCMVNEQIVNEISTTVYFQNWEKPFELIITFKDVESKQAHTARFSSKDISIKNDQESVAA